MDPAERIDVTMAWLKKFCDANNCEQNAKFNGWNFYQDSNGVWSSYPCEDGWYGITCDAKAPEARIVGLSLSHSNLKGTFPEGIAGALDQLRTLDLSHNAMTGAVPWSLLRLSL